jgi:hypothetical protein
VKKSKTMFFFSSLYSGDISKISMIVKKGFAVCLGLLFTGKAIQGI